MKRKLIVLIALGIVSLALLAGCALLYPSAKFEIVGWEQTYYESLREWSRYVRVTYKVTNTGVIDIDYYQVWFEVECTDGSKFRERAIGLDVKAGEYVTASTSIDTMKKKATQVRITDFELKNY